MSRFKLVFVASVDNQTITAQYYQFEHGFITFYEKQSNGHYDRTVSLTASGLKSVRREGSGNNN